MIVRFPRKTLILGAASLTLGLSGCMSPSKTTYEVPGNAAAAIPSVKHSQFTLFNFAGGGSKLNPAEGKTPGSAEFSSGKTLKSPESTYLAHAVWHEQEGNLTEARNSYNMVLNKNPKNIEAMLGLARIEISLGRMTDAETRLTKAQKLAPKNPQVEVALGQYYSARNDWPHALEHMQAARGLAPDDPVFAYHLGNVQAKSGLKKEALANFAEAVGAPQAHYNLAVILNEQGEFAEAELHLQQALAKKPDLRQAQQLLTLVRQQRHGSETQFAKFTKPDRGHGASSSSDIQPASYTEPADAHRDTVR
jgi:tetratricopeptide (TPR) repeat protein